MPVAAQIAPEDVVESAEPVLPPSASPPPGAKTAADPLRVYGDDAPLFSDLVFAGASGLQVAASMRTEYNDNLYHLSSSPDGPAARGSSRGDWLFIPSLTVGAGRRLGDQRLFFVGNAGRDIYARNTGMSRNRIGLNGGLDWALAGACRGQLLGGYSRRTAQLALFEDVIPSTQTKWNLQGGGSCRSADGTALAFGYNNYGISNQAIDPLARIDRSDIDVKGQTATLGIGHTLGDRGEIGVRGNWQQHRFPNQILAGGKANGTSIWTASAYASFAADPDFRLSGSIGKSWADPYAPFTSRFAGLSWDLGATYSGPRLGIFLNVGKRTESTTGGLYNYKTSDFRNATINYLLGDRVHLSSGFALADITYNAFGLSPASPQIYIYEDRRYFAAADYRMNEILSLSLDVNNHRRTSINVVPYSYRVNIVSFNVKANF